MARNNSKESPTTSSKSPVFLIRSFLFSALSPSNFLPIISPSNSAAMLISRVILPKALRSNSITAMRGKRWVGFCLGAMVSVIGIALFYFVSETRSPQWIGVPESEISGADAQTPIAPDAVSEKNMPSSGNEEPVLSEAERSRMDVDLRKKEAESRVSGETAVSIGFADGSAGRRPVADVQVSVDPATLETVDRTLWTMLRPVYDPLLSTIEAPKADALCRLLLGPESLAPETKLPDSHASVRPQRKAISKPKVAPQPVDPTTSEDLHLQNLISQTQMSPDSSLKDGDVPIQKVTSPTELGLACSTLQGNPLFKEPVTGRILIGH